MKKDKIIYKTEETQELKKFILTFIIVLGLIFSVFLISKCFIKTEVKELSYTDGSISTTSVIVGTIFENPETEYYVLAYDTTKENANAYTTYGEYYTSKQKNAIKIYYLNLSSAFNKDYYVTSNSNKNAKKINDLKMVDGTLLHIKNKKITQYIEGIDNIANTLKVTEEK